MNKIAILSCAKSAASCCCVDCLRFLAERDRSFSAYAGQEVQIAGLTTCCGCDTDPLTDEVFASKIAHLVKAGVTEVHVSACVTSQKKNCPRKKAMLEALRNGGMELRFIEKQS